MRTRPARRAVLGALLAVSAAPGALLAQPAARSPKIGLLLLDNMQPPTRLLQSALREIGYVEGKNLQLEVRAAGGKTDVLAGQAAELVRMKVDVIVAVLTGSVKAAMQATQSIPIVMAAGAPVETGLVKSLSRPGGNVTGVSATGGELGAKTLQVMKEILPALGKVGVLLNANDTAFGNHLLDQVRGAARTMKIEIEAHTVAPDRLSAAFTALAQSGAQLVVAQPSLTRAAVLELSSKHRLPVVSPSSSYAEAGALLSYAVSQVELMRTVARYVQRILNGASPATLPVEQLNAYEFIINLKAAREFGIAIPQTVLMRADRVVGP